MFEDSPIKKIENFDFLRINSRSLVPLEIFYNPKEKKWKYNSGKFKYSSIEELPNFYCIKLQIEKDLESLLSLLKIKNRSLKEPLYHYNPKTILDEISDYKVPLKNEIISYSILNNENKDIQINLLPSTSK